MLAVEMIQSTPFSECREGNRGPDRPTGYSTTTPRLSGKTGNRGEGSHDAPGSSPVSLGVASLGLLALGGRGSPGAGSELEISMQELCWGCWGGGRGKLKWAEGEVGLSCSLHGSLKPQPIPWRGVGGDKEGAGWGLLRKGVTLGEELSLALANPQETCRWENRGFLPEEDPRGSSRDHHVGKREAYYPPAVTSAGDLHQTQHHPQMRSE